MKADKGKLGAVEFDLRVRERNLAKGVLDPKSLERHLAELLDVASNAEAIGVPQPALSDSDDLDGDLEDSDDGSNDDDAPHYGSM